MLRIILLLSMLITATNASFAGNPLSDFGNWITGRGSDLIPQGPELPNGGAGNWSLPPPSPPGQISCETIYSPFSGHNEYVDQRATEAYCNPTPKSASTSNEPVKLNKDVTDPSNFVKLTPPEPPQPAPEPDPQYDPYDATNTFDPAETSLAQPTYEAPSTPQYQAPAVTTQDNPQCQEVLNALVTAQPGSAIVGNVQQLTSWYNANCQ